MAIRSGKYVAATSTEFPAASANTGALAQALDTGTLYISDGTSWNAVASITSGGSLLGADGAIYALTEATPYVNLTATGTAFTGACELAGFDCTAVTGSPTITIYDNTSAAGTVIVPATTLTVGRTEFAYKRALTTGCHVVLSGTQTVNVLVG